MITRFCFEVPQPLSTLGVMNPGLWVNLDRGVLSADHLKLTPSRSVYVTIRHLSITYERVPVWLVD